jgi:hypothetical protein
MHLFAVLFIVSPAVTPFPVDPETAVDSVIDDFTIEDPYLSAEQPGKQTPLIIPISPILSLL